ncbi:MAG: substrate-binding domain-containing protein [Betaproteobacteria bacterium]
MDVRLLSAGAAQGLVESLRETLRANVGAYIEGSFGAVGALLERFRAGERCDAIILTASMIAGLELAGRVLQGSSAPLGRVRTGVAVRDADPLPAIADRAQLAATLGAASTLYVPDIVRSTAGIHVAQVLKRLGIYDDVAPRLSLHPNGATAMRALAEADAPGGVGCTQITEIRYTRGVTLVGALPAEFELATVYSVAVCTEARDIELARNFAGLLSGPATQALRAKAGFE